MKTEQIIAKKSCSIPGCGKLVSARGWCETHYCRWRRHGDPLMLTFPPITPEKFWQLVIKDETSGCWNFQKGRQANGYCRISVNGQLWSAHRYARFLSTGKAVVLQILHSCDNRQCVNPEHLREGTALENAADKLSRNRQAKGSTIHNTVLNESTVREIKTLLARGVAGVAIAARFNISTQIVSSIKKEKTWKWLTI